MLKTVISAFYKSVIPTERSVEESIYRLLFVWPLWELMVERKAPASSLEIGPMGF